MSDIFGRIGRGALESLGGGAGGRLSNVLFNSLGLLGEVGNFLDEQKYADWIDKQIALQDFYIDAAKSPEKALALRDPYEKALNQGLVKNVARQVQANVGQRGLSDSPNVMANIYAQSLGPLQQEEQRLADQLFLGVYDQPTRVHIPDFRGGSRFSPTFNVAGGRGGAGGAGGGGGQGGAGGGGGRGPSTPGRADTGGSTAPGGRMPPSLGSGRSNDPSFPPHDRPLQEDVTTRLLFGGVFDEQGNQIGFFDEHGHFNPFGEVGTAADLLTDPNTGNIGTFDENGNFFPLGGNISDINPPFLPDPSPPFGGFGDGGGGGFDFSGVGEFDNFNPNPFAPDDFSFGGGGFDSRGGGGGAGPAEFDLVDPGLFTF